MIQQSRLRGMLLRVGGGVVTAAGVGTGLAYAISNLAVAIAGALVAYGGVRILNRGRRHFVPIGLDHLDRDPRPPILYLRPFDDDGAEFQVSPDTIHRGWGHRGAWRQFATLFRLIHTNEQFLSRAFRDIGPLVAIGHPEEKLPRLGATRVYARGDTEWQRLVADIADHASYVILQIGHSDGLLWEVQFVVNHVRPEQLILCIPAPRVRLTRPTGPAKRERARQEHYQEFRRITRQVFPMPLPEGIGSAMFMYFDTGWVPRPSHYQPVAIYPFGRIQRHPDNRKLEALAWLNSVIN